MTEKYVTIPISEKDVRELKVGDQVYVNGIIHTMRDMAHRRVVDITRKGEKIPFKLKNGVIWHCGPIAKKIDNEWKIMSAGPTSSSRFTELGAKIVRDHHVRLIIGKGSMGSSIIKALRDVGGAYLLATGGCGALYAKKITNVKAVHWLELGMPEAAWILDVNQFGPLIVGIDSYGNSLTQMQYNKTILRVKDICKKEKIDEARTYIWWPKKNPGTREAIEPLDSIE